MPTFEHTVVIEAPIDRVFEFGADPENWQRVTPSLTNVEIVEETENGYRLKGTWKMLGMKLSGDMEFVIVEPNEHTVTSFDSSGMSGELHYQYSDTPTGTQVVQSADYEFGDSLLDRVIEPVAKRYNKRQFKNALETSKELIEAAETIEPTV